MFIKGTLTVILFVNLILFTVFSVTKNASLPLFLINLVSVFILWLYLLHKTITKKFLINCKADLFLATLILAVTIILGFYKVDSVTPGMWGDEVTVASTGEKILADWKSIPFVNVATGYTKPFLFIEGVVIKTFGRDPAAIRTLSIISGAFAAAAFFIFLRLFFNRFSSFVATILFVGSYPFLVILRLAYNITAALFFEILSLIFLYLYYSRKKNLYLLGLGLSLGLGLYTYVGFRTFALAICVITFIAILKNKDTFKAWTVEVVLYAISVFIAGNAFISFSFSQPAVAMSRIKTLSVFGQGLPVPEVSHEIRGATLRLTNIFLPRGDPSARSNPSGVSMFDPLTTFLLFAGLVILYKRNKTIFRISLFLILPFIANDIFSLERIPEFHYYGIGHPNTYRLSGIIPIFYFWLTWNLAAFIKLSKRFEKIVIYTEAAVAVVILVININRYFNQESINKIYYRYNYIFNGVASLKAAKIIKDSNLGEVRLSESFVEDPRIKYFSGKDVQLVTFDPKNGYEALSVIQSNELTIVDVRNNLELSEKIASDWQADPTLFYMRLEKNPFGEPDLLILSKAND